MCYGDVARQEHKKNANKSASTGERSEMQNSALLNARRVFCAQAEHHPNLRRTNVGIARLMHHQDTRVAPGVATQKPEFPRASMVIDTPLYRRRFFFCFNPQSWLLPA
jgi:hypothetical protein